jgi:hypothetical protein
MSSPGTCRRYRGEQRLAALFRVLTLVPAALGVKSPSRKFGGFGWPERSDALGFERAALGPDRGDSVVDCQGS